MSTKNHLKIERLLSVFTHVLNQFTQTNIAATYTATRTGTKCIYTSLDSMSMPIMVKCGWNFVLRLQRTFSLLTNSECAFIL